MKRFCLIFCFVFLQLSFSISMGQDSITVNLDKIMTKDEQRAMGLQKLTNSERDALEQWLGRWTDYVLQYAVHGGGNSNTPSRPLGYAGTGMKHWISRNIDSGAMVKLEDGSLWQISRIDKITSMLWLPASNIMVLEADQAIGEYKYVLVNMDDGDKVYAKYFGKE